MKIIYIVIVALLPFTVSAQSKAMRQLVDEYPDARVIMIYHSSLNMLNMDDDPDFARMIRDIEKIKVLIIDKEGEDYNEKTLPALKSELSDTGFEKLMVVKSKDYDIGAYILEEDDDIEGFFFVMEEDDSLVAVDLVGSMPVSDIGQLMEKLQEAQDF